MNLKRALMFTLVWLAAMLFAPCKGAQPDTNSPPPGIVVSFSPASSGQYLGSPSIAVLTNGYYVVSHDYFGPSASQQLTSIFSSSDQGHTWQRHHQVKLAAHQTVGMESGGTNGVPAASKPQAQVQSG
jgi:hypothetical protein